MFKKIVIGFTLGFLMLVTNQSHDMLETLFLDFDEDHNGKLSK
jgi:hypothetical protein